MPDMSNYSVNQPSDLPSQLTELQALNQELYNKVLEQLNVIYDYEHC